jgi:phospholipase/carboxylesterase
MKLEPIVLEPPSGEAKYAVIWLHGLGADGTDFANIVPQLNLPENHGIRFIFPTAPIAPVTINGGMEMRCWYDIRSLDLMNDVDAAGIRVSCYRVFDMIAQQRELGILPENIVLAGFSQGGVIALHSALSYEFRLAGVIALSTYFPMHHAFFQHRGLPIFYGHGTEDEILPLAVAEQSKALLEQKGYDVTWRTYPMGHSVCLEELEDISQWLKETLSLDRAES